MEKNISEISISFCQVSLGLGLFIQNPINSLSGDSRSSFTKFSGKSLE